MSKKKGIDLGKQEGGSNLFGGSNSTGLYVPMSEIEQEAIHRLVEAEDLVLIIHGWGRMDRPRFLLGDHRIAVKFKITFNRPATPMPVYFLDLELRTRTGITLIKERLPLMYAGKPVTVQAGIFLDLQWDIAIHSMDPRLVKLILPHARGLTSRRQDKDTGEMTAQGNMRLSSGEKAALALLEATQKRIRQEDAKKIVEVTEKAGYTVRKTDKGYEAEDV